MNRRLLSVSLLWLGLSGFSWSLSTKADYHPAQETYEIPRVERSVDRMSRKFWRGVVNVVTGIGELPRQTALACRESGALVGVPVGFVNGLIMTPVRVGVGAFETVSFIVPTTPGEHPAAKRSYAPLLNPTFVWQSE